MIAAVGQLAIDAVERVTLDEITKADAVAAGLPDLASLQSQLMRLSPRKDAVLKRL
ncbi:MAG: hypothetical protein OER90_08110 [Gemmatimonadota bacterium]|nr:hypothetical protein [Gemmatimonadota bacterium]